MKNKNKKNKYKVILLKNLKWFLVAFLFIFLALISFFLYKQQKETNLKRLEIEKQNLILAEKEEKKKIEEQIKLKIEECEAKIDLEQEKERTSLEKEKEKNLDNFYSTTQYLEAKQDLEESKTEYNERVASVNKTLEALCDYTNRAPGESPTSILSECQSYREKFFSQLANLKVTLIDQKEDEIEVLKLNYYKSVETDFNQDLDDLEQSFNNRRRECNEEEEN